MVKIFKCVRFLLCLSVLSLGLTACRSTFPPVGGQKEIRVVLVGDSTVTDKAGWGGAIGKFFHKNAKVINFARSGRSSKSYINEGWLSKALATGPDYVIIQFGHNDCPGKGPERETDSYTSFRKYISKYIAEARKINAQPILVTPMTRRNYDEQGRIKSILTPYAQAVKQIGREQNIPVIDLHSRSIALFERLGDAGVSKLQPKGDRTHFNKKGAQVLAKIIAEELSGADIELSKYLK